jgi:anti-anti-sigma regulatory factor
MAPVNFPVTVSAFESTIAASGFLNAAIGADLRSLARTQGRSSERIVIALDGVTGADEAGVEALTQILGDALEGGWGLQLTGASDELRSAAGGHSLPFT